MQKHKILKMEITTSTFALLFLHVISNESIGATKAVKWISRLNPSIILESERRHLIRIRPKPIMPHNPICTVLRSFFQEKNSDTKYHSPYIVSNIAILSQPRFVPACRLTWLGDDISYSWLPQKILLNKYVKNFVKFVEVHWGSGGPWAPGAWVVPQKFRHENNRPTRKELTANYKVRKTYVVIFDIRCKWLFRARDRKSLKLLPPDDIF